MGGTARLFANLAGKAAVKSTTDKFHVTSKTTPLQRRKKLKRTAII
jgi:hypothetical protein